MVESSRVKYSQVERSGAMVLEIHSTVACVYL